MPSPADRPRMAPSTSRSAVLDGAGLSDGFGDDRRYASSRAGEIRRSSTRLATATTVAAWTGTLSASAPPDRPALTMAPDLVAGMELSGGNISLLLTLAIVVGFRWPAACRSCVTKITPFGLLVRRAPEWRQRAALQRRRSCPGLGRGPARRCGLDDVLVRNADAGRTGTWAALPVPLWSVCRPRPRSSSGVPGRLADGRPRRLDDRLPARGDCRSRRCIAAADRASDSDDPAIAPMPARRLSRTPQQVASRSIRSSCA